MLLTRSPLHMFRRTLSLDLHVLSTPPAFVLSQDQTLHQCTSPEGPESRHSPDGSDKKISATEVNQQIPSCPFHPPRIRPDPPTTPNGTTKEIRAGHMALTFGTLLSSQGTDAHRPRPSGRSRGNSPSLSCDVMTVNVGGRARAGTSARAASSRGGPRPSVSDSYRCRPVLRVPGRRYEGGATSSNGSSREVAHTSPARRSTTAMAFLPRRSTRKRPCSQSPSPGTADSSPTRRLLR